MKLLIFLVLVTWAESVHAQDCPIKKDGGVCLTKEQKEEFKKAIAELEEIHTSDAVVTIEPIILIRDWENRVYINGQEGKPIKLKLKMGSTIDRDLEMKLPIQVYYREAPPPPMFRLRIRAELGLLSTPLVDGFDVKNSLDGGIGWDFFGIWGANLAAFTGVRSVGLQIGYDLTKNFGLSGGYHFIYDGFRGSAGVLAYFSFN